MENKILKNNKVIKNIIFGSLLCGSFQGTLTQVGVTAAKSQRSKSHFIKPQALGAKNVHRGSRTARLPMPKIQATNMKPQIEKRAQVKPAVKASNPAFYLFKNPRRNAVKVEEYGELIHKYYIRGNNQKAKQMIENGTVGVKDQDRESHTLLYYAVANNNNPEMVRFLLRRGADVNATDSYGKTIRSARRSSSAFANERNFAAYQEVELLLLAAANGNSIPTVSKKTRKTWKAYGMMNGKSTFQQNKNKICQWIQKMN
jgi:hypothetical protein